MSKINFSKTTFIIGAGAHVPYFYPTAKKLTDLLKALHKEGNKVISIQPALMIHLSSKYQTDKIKICQYLMQLNLVEKPEKISSSNDYDVKLGNVLENFLIEFGRSQVYSIDAYLANYLQRPIESQDKLVPILGKLLISYFILNYENQVPIGFHEFDWIQFIINQYLKDKNLMEEFFKNPPHFYTFNYDNHFEKSLFYHLISYHGLSEKDALDKVNSLNINHIYGHINSLNIKSEKDIHDRSIKELLVIGEERAAKKIEDVSKNISKSFKNSNEVYLLGFGFDQLNMEIIFRHIPKGMADNFYPSFFATNIGFSKFQQRIVSETSPVKINFFSNKEVNSLELLSRVKPVFEKRNNLKSQIILE